ncbi:MAG: hypothetical protein LWX07_00570 [Bacteroidetes bacterium]|nr:hypothetical protein [Bacteroidota bacterium]
MKPNIAIYCCILFFSSLCLSQEKNNLLINGNFELGMTSDSIPVGWKWNKDYYRNSVCRIVDDGGNKILMLENIISPAEKCSMFSQKVDNVKSCEIELSARFKASVSDSVQFFIRCNDSSNNPVAFGSKKYSGNGNWQVISSKIDVPSETKYILVMNLLLGKGKAYFDDLSLKISKIYKRGKTNVVILGCEHSSQLINPKMSPAVFRAFFNRVKPDAVCLETKSEYIAAAKFFSFSYESWGIAYPWAEKNNVPVYGVDWQPDIKADERYGTKMDFNKRKRVLPQSDFNGLEFNPDYDLFFADIDTFEFNRLYLNNISNPAAEGKWNDEGFRRYMLFRDMIISQNILDVAVNYQCGTLLLVYGAAHKAGLEYYLQKYFGDDVNIVKPSSYGYPTAAEIEKEVLREDEIAVCYFLLKDNNWNGEANRFPFERLDSILNKYESVSADDIELKYLRGRYYLQKGDTAKYLACLNDVINSGNDMPRSYPKPDMFFHSRDSSSVFGNNEESFRIMEGYDYLTVRQFALCELSEFYLAACNKAKRDYMLSLIKKEINVHPKAAPTLEYFIIK